MKEKNIQDKISKLIKFNPFCLMFVVDSISKNVDAVLEDEDLTLEQMKHSFVSGQAWIETAKQFKQELNW